MTTVGAGADVGLTAAEAAARLAQHGPNVLPERRAPTFARRVAKQLAEPLVVILAAAGIASVAVVRQTKEGLAILVIVLLDVVAGAWQEHRADKAIAALSDLTPPLARVRRDGAVVVVPAADVVVGDVVELAAGDRVPADLALLVAESMAADESLLTGESFPADKAVGDDAYAGSLVVRGRGVGRVTATGSHTELGAIASSLAEPPPPPLQADLRAVGHVIAAVAVGIGALLVVVAAVRAQGDDGLAEALLAGISLAVAAIPEGLPAAVTLALAMGAQRMAKRGAVVRRLGAIEALGSTTVLCIDKTGTLTEGTLAVVGVDPVAGRLADLLDALLRCNDAFSGGVDPVDVALARQAAELGLDRPMGERLAERPFDAATRVMATVHDVDGRLVLSVKGAPEAVIERCRSGPDTDALAEAAALAAVAGERVLAAADGTGGAPDTFGLRPLGLVRMADPLRPSARRAVEACRRAGVRIVLVTGDHRDTAVAVAEASGLDTEPVVTQAELDSLADPADAAVVARCTPAVKVDLVTAHRGRGGVIAMTGDGVNDAPALRHADVGVAVSGGAGTDVARQAADVVVTNGDLGTLVAAIREGRRIYRNLVSVVSYLVAGNLSEIMVVMAGVVLIPELAVPLLPVQLLWVNLITDGLPALALGVDRPPGDPMSGPPRAREGRLLDLRRLGALAARAVVIAAAVLATAAFARHMGWAPVVQRTQLMTTLVVAHLALAYGVRADHRTFDRGWQRNRLLLLAVAGSMALQVAVVASPARSLFDVAGLPAAGWLAAGVAVAVAVAGFDAVRAVERAVGSRSSAER